MVKRIMLFLFPVPPEQRFERAMASVEKRIARIERRLLLHVPPIPAKPVRVRILWRAQEEVPR